MSDSLTNGSSKRVFLLLLHNRERIVYKDQIIEFLWPDVVLEKANAQLYTTVYLIRRVTKELGDHFQLMNRTNGYILFTRNMEIDVEVWEKTIQELHPVTK